MAQDGGSGRQNQDRNSSGSSLLLWAGLIVLTGLAGNLPGLWLWLREPSPVADATGNPVKS